MLLNILERLTSWLQSANHYATVANISRVHRPVQSEVDLREGRAQLPAEAHQAGEQ